MSAFNAEGGKISGLGTGATSAPLRRSGNGRMRRQMSFIMETSSGMIRGLAGLCLVLARHLISHTSRSRHHRQYWRAMTNYTGRRDIMTEGSTRIVQPLAQWPVVTSGSAMDHSVATKSATTNLNGSSDSGRIIRSTKVAPVRTVAVSFSGLSFTSHSIFSQPPPL